MCCHRNNYNEFPHLSVFNCLFPCHSNTIVFVSLVLDGLVPSFFFLHYRMDFLVGYFLFFLDMYMNSHHLCFIRFYFGGIILVCSFIASFPLYDHIKDGLFNSFFLFVKYFNTILRIITRRCTL